MARTTKEKLKEKYRLLVKEFFSNGMNKTYAASSVGYKDGNRNADKLFNRPEVKRLIEKELRRLEKKHEVTTDWIIEKLKLIAQGGEVLARYVKVTEDGKLEYDFTGATPEDLKYLAWFSTEVYTEGRGDKARAVKKFKLHLLDPKGALDSLARIKGLFQDKLTVEGELSVVEKLNAGRQRVSSEKDNEGD